MYTTGLVLTFGDDVEKASTARERLAAAGPFVLGEQTGPCQVAVLEADSPQAAQDWHDWVMQVPGIASVEVMVVHWEAPAVVKS